MSRIAKVPIKIPKGVQVAVGPEMALTLKGPKGERKLEGSKRVSISHKGETILVERQGDEQEDRAFHGLWHRLITTAIKGVVDGYSEELELHGVGYKAEMRGKTLAVSCGLSHEIKHVPPATISIATPNPTRIIVSGVDKQVVGQQAAKIRSYALPEPYKGKGIRYVGEAVRRKVGKSGAK